MKRILHITTYLNIGGISSYLLTLCQGLQALGDECHVASFGGELEEEFQKAVLKYKPYIKKSTIFELFYKPSNVRNQKGKKLVLLEIQK